MTTVSDRPGTPDPTPDPTPDRRRSGALAATGEDLPVVRRPDLADRVPMGVVVDGVDLVVVRDGDRVRVFEGRCPHRGALLGDGSCVGEDLVCGVHGWDFRIDTGVSAYDPTQRLHRFPEQVVDGVVTVRAADLAAFRASRPAASGPAASGPAASGTDVYDRLFADPHQATPEEPYVGEIHDLARNGLSRTGHHGPVAAMGVP